jgi:PAS domain-containing protein
MPFPPGERSCFMTAHDRTPIVSGFAAPRRPGDLETSREGENLSGPELDYEALFDSAPTPYLVLTPDLVIVGMNKAREQVTGRPREEVIGRHLFDMFPDPPDDETATGVQNLRASLERVLATKAPDTMPMQKYDLADPETGAFTERWWSPVNVPVLDDDGEVVLLLHRVTGHRPGGGSAHGEDGRRRRPRLQGAGRGVAVPQHQSPRDRAGACAAAR